MKKLLQLGLLLIGASSFAQDGLTCATALPVTLASNTATVNCPAITGTYTGSCLPVASTSDGGNANPNAMYFTYTATANGELTITSNLPANDGITKSSDTRLSVLTGTSCTTLSCYDSNDDINYSGGNALSAVTIPVAQGTTYYIMWDSGWNALPFDFTVTLDSSVCIRPATVDVNLTSDITTTSAYISWNAAIGNPAGYDVEYGPVGFTQGTGTPLSTATNSATINVSSANAGANLEYYYKSDCGGGSTSAWVGPNPAYLAKTMPYSNNFDNTNDPYDGFIPAGGWSIASSTTMAQSGSLFAYSESSTTAATNAALFTRAISLQAFEQFTMTFYTRLFNADSNGNPIPVDPQTLYVYVNNALSGTGATPIGSAITVSGTTYVQQTVTYTAQSAGTYYFAFINATPVVTNAGFMLLDTVNMTSNLKVNDYLTSQFAVYPNPAKNTVTFSNGINAVIDTVEMTDLNGRVVKSAKVNAAEGQVSISDLAAGVYIMRISTDQGIATKKIIKE